MNNLSPAEIVLIKDQKGVNGSFHTALCQAIRVADIENRAKLAKGFPELVKVIWRFQYEPGYWENLCARWNQENPNETIKP